ncbi:MAG: hypothetical protein AB7I32_09965 [Gammaproteobacteria bacterium]
MGTDTRDVGLVSCNRPMRCPQRGHHDGAAIPPIPDEGPICHVAFARGAQPRLRPRGRA